MLANELSFSPLLEDACRAMERCHWKDARSMLEAVIAADPNNATAKRLMATINLRLPENQGGALSTWPTTSSSRLEHAYGGDPNRRLAFRSRLESVFGIFAPRSQRW